MTRSVKPRPYSSPLREQRAQETRKAILDAAERQFTSAGYVRTRLSDVAADAGVSLATVKLVLGTKTNLLLNLWHRTLAGGLDDGVPVMERDWARSQDEIEDPVEKLRASAVASTMIKKRVAGLVHLIEQAAPLDAELADLWSRMQSEHREVVGLFTEQLHEAGHLRPGLAVGDAGDIMWTLGSPLVYRLFRTRGWTPERYAKWLFQSLCHELLGKYPDDVEVGDIP